MGFILNLAYFRIGHFSERNLPEIALEALEEGFDSPSLVLLAGVTEQDDPLRLQRYFTAALSELGLELPNEMAARWSLVSGIARSILENQMDIMTGVAEMNEIVRNGGFDGQNKVYVYDSIGYKKIYGLYDNIEDALGAEVAWRNRNENFDQTIGDAKRTLYEEIKIWLGKAGNSPGGHFEGHPTQK